MIPIEKKGSSFVAYANLRNRKCFELFHQPNNFGNALWNDNNEFISIANVSKYQVNNNQVMRQIKTRPFSTIFNSSCVIFFSYKIYVRNGLHTHTHTHKTLLSVRSCLIFVYLKLMGHLKWCYSLVCVCVCDSAQWTI